MMCSYVVSSTLNGGRCAFDACAPPISVSKSSRRDSGAPL